MNTSLNQCQGRCNRYRPICHSYPLAGDEGGSRPTGKALAADCRAAAAAWTAEGPGITFDAIDAQLALPLRELAAPR